MAARPVNGSDLTPELAAWRVPCTWGPDVVGVTEVTVGSVVVGVVPCVSPSTCGWVDVGAR